jgi:hypothetical protein
MRGMLFGVALNGVGFDPGTAEFWNNDRRGGWNHAALVPHPGEWAMPEIGNVIFRRYTRAGWETR